MNPMDVDTAPAVQQPPPPTNANQVERQEIESQNIAYATQPRQVNKKQFLDSLYEILEDEDETAECLEELKQLDPSNTKYMDLHPLQRLLNLGLDHENYLKANKQFDELVFKKDRLRQWHYEPYRHLAKRTQKFVSQKNPQLLPEFNLLDPKTPKQFGDECRAIMENEFSQRYEFVKPHLSWYHQKLLECNMNTTLGKLKKNQESVANNMGRSSLSTVMNPMVALNVTPKLTGCIKPVMTSLVTPAESSPDKKRKRSSDQPSVLLLPICSSTGFDSNLHLSEEDEREEAMTDVQNPLPRLVQNTIPVAMETNQVVNSPENGLIENKANQVECLTAGKQVSNSRIDAASNNVPSDAPNNNQKLLFAALQLLRTNCEAELKYLTKSGKVTEGTSELTYILNACENGMKIEKETNQNCQQYRNIIVELTAWVVELEKLNALSEPLAQELLQEAKNSVEDDKEKALKTTIRRYASESMLKVTGNFLPRSAAVGPYMSANDRFWLQGKMKDATKEARLEAENRMEESCRRFRASCIHLLYNYPRSGNAPDPVSELVMENLY